MQRAMYAGAVRFGFRLVHYAVMGNHVHFLVEAPDKRALARALKGLGVRIARALNRVMKRHGRVIGDRYHAHIFEDAGGGEARTHVSAYERAAPLPDCVCGPVCVADRRRGAADVAPPARAAMTAF